MPFTIDEDSLTIKGRKGDSASFTFEFENDLTGLSIDFEVRKNCDEPIITKTFSNITDNAIVVNLTAEDTAKCPVLKGNYTSYYWGLKIHDGADFAQTLIPDGLSNPPLFIVYPEIVG